MLHHQCVTTCRQAHTTERDTFMNNDQLISAAQSAMLNAYAPYSKFPVGAAVRSDTGNIYTGCNVENAAYPIGQCAEASAISAMVSAGERTIAAIAVAGKGQALCTPCGGCRQRIREFATDTTPVLVCDESSLRHETTIGELLPLSFGPENL